MSNTGSDHNAENLVLIVHEGSMALEKLGVKVSESEYRFMTVPGLAPLLSILDERSVMAVILDIDSLALENSTIRDLTKLREEIVLFGISRERFHPNLQEAIGKYLFACLPNPISSDELRFWLRCAAERAHHSRASPDSKTEQVPPCSPPTDVTTIPKKTYQEKP